METAIIFLLAIFTAATAILAFALLRSIQDDNPRPTDPETDVIDQFGSV